MQKCHPRRFPSFFISLHSSLEIKTNAEGELMKIASGCRIQLLGSSRRTSAPSNCEADTPTQSAAEQQSDQRSSKCEFSHFPGFIWSSRIETGPACSCETNCPSTSHQNSFKLFNSVHHKLGSDLEPSWNVCLTCERGSTQSLRT